MQEMDYQGGYRDEPPVAPVYQGTPPPQYNTYTGGPAGQKLSGLAQNNVTGNGPSARQRLALALVSLILWMGFFMGITFAVVAIASSDIMNFSMRIFIILMLVSGMLIFTGLVIFINALFNRNKR